MRIYLPLKWIFIEAARLKVDKSLPYNVLITLFCLAQIHSHLSHYKVARAGVFLFNISY